ncbi:MAG: hypothetical protein P0Y55_14415 [Candidatus Cohnella colombiensis]|uniref:Uncharacterized protein n=1 Tax=Candidatus Cohnella colombiensis TaxID=3121368 RepID=A0AA95EV84_9BACL|nr:MAG: hypothetical protein P0Y55_14415 [Cohnella sp.]
MPSVFITVAKTKDEAVAKRTELLSYIHPEVGLKFMSFAYGIDFNDLRK